MIAFLQLTTLLPLWFPSPTYRFRMVPLGFRMADFPTFDFYQNQFSFLYAGMSSNLQVNMANSITHSNDSSLALREQTTKACSHSTLASDNLVTLKSVASNRLAVEKCFPTSIPNYITFILYFSSPKAPIFYYHYPRT